MNWKDIPPLSALRGFEATARHATYAAAADELNVTDAALRQHVRTLEAYLGCHLVVRAGRGIALTDEGRRLANALSAGFQTILAGVSDLKRDAAERPVRVACTPAFAENWLVPRLPAFWKTHPEISVDLAPSLRNADLAAGGHDMAIRYGRGSWDWPDVRRLVSAAYTVVHAPHLAIADLAHATWLFEEGREEHAKWSAERGIHHGVAEIRLYPTNSLVLSAVRAGHGVSVQSWALIEHDLEAGILKAIDREPDDDLAYYLLLASKRAACSIFADWLIEEASA